MKSNGKNDIQLNRRELLRGRNVWPMCKARKKRDISYPIHCHEYYEICYYERSQGYCVINGKEYPLLEKSVFFLTPKDMHSIHAQNDEESLYIVISFTHEAIDKRLIAELSVAPRVLYEPSETLTALLKSIYAVRRSTRAELHKRSIQGHMLNAALVDILMLGTVLESDSYRLNPTVEKAVLYIMSHLTEPLSLAEIAAACHTSPAYFSALFHRETEKTLKSYINELRVDMAKHLLCETKESIQSIALQCGYSTTAHFMKIFKATTGETPTAYRKEHDFFGK